MSHKWFPAVVVAVVLIAFMGLLAMGGMATLAFVGRAQDGQHLGFMPFFCGMGTFFTMGLFFLLLLVVGKSFRYWAWRKASGPEGKNWAAHWREHWHRHHGPMPPWCWEKPSSEEGDETEPDVESKGEETKD